MPREFNKLSSTVRIHGYFRFIFHRLRGMDRAAALSRSLTIESRLSIPAVSDKSNHPYDTPEVISVAIEDGSAKYLEWIRAGTTSAAVTAPGAQASPPMHAAALAAAAPPAAKESTNVTSAAAGASNAIESAP